MTDNPIEEENFSNPEYICGQFTLVTGCRHTQSAMFDKIGTMTGHA